MQWAGLCRTGVMSVLVQGATGLGACRCSRRVVRHLMSELAPSSFSLMTGAAAEPLLARRGSESRPALLFAFWSKRFMVLHSAGSWHSALLHYML